VPIPFVVNDPFDAPDAWPDDPHDPYEEPPRQLPFGLAFDISRGFDSGMAAVRAAPLAMWVGGVLMVLFDGHYSGGGDSDDGLSSLVSGAGDTIAVMGSKFSALQDAIPTAGVILVGLVVAAAMLLGHAFFRTGFLRQMHTVHAYGEEGYRDLFSGADAMLSMLGSTLLQGLVYIVIAAPFAAGAGAAFYFLDEGPAFAVTALLALLAIGPLIYAYLGMCLASFRVALDGDGPIESLRSSWSLADGNRWSLFKFGFVMVLVECAAALVGVMLLCIGMLVTVPLGRALTGVAWTESYLLATRGAVD
jgi:hypothetical protein